MGEDSNQIHVVGPVVVVNAGGTLPAGAFVVSMGPRSEGVSEFTMQSVMGATMVDGLYRLSAEPAIAAMLSTCTKYPLTTRTHAH